MQALLRLPWSGDMADLAQKKDAFSCTIIELPTVGSTNDHAKALAKSGYPEGTLVFAHEQTAGRGRQGNQWVSQKGNVFMSLVLRPQVVAMQMGQLSFLCALALARTMQELSSSLPVALKWPNDLLIDGKKAAGILLETETNGVRPVPWIVAGIGVNLAHGPEGATSLKDMGVQIEPRAFIEKLIHHISALYEEWKAQGFAPIQKDWMALAHNLGKEISVRLPRETLRGVFHGIDAQGALELETENGKRHLISSGEVYV